MMPHAIQVGDKYGKLTVLSYSHTKRNRFYNVVCDCGNERTIIGTSLTNGGTKSCGCLKTTVGRLKRIDGNYSEITSIVSAYKRGAESRGFKLNLTREEIETLIKQDCFYCGMPPSNVKKKQQSEKGFAYSGLDRIDNTKDYDKENVVPCCKMCNYAKRNVSFDDFKEWALRIGKMADNWPENISL